jgi:hypothetical protein
MEIELDASNCPLTDKSVPTPRSPVIETEDPKKASESAETDSPTVRESKTDNDSPMNEQPLTERFEDIRHELSAATLSRTNRGPVILQLDPPEMYSDTLKSPPHISRVSMDTDPVLQKMSSLIETGESKTAKPSTCNEPIMSVDEPKSTQLTALSDCSTLTWLSNSPTPPAVNVDPEKTSPCIDTDSSK